MESLDKGAVENWLVRMFCYGKKRGMELDWTFYCTIGSRGRLEEIVKKYGGKIVYSKFPLHQKIKFVKALRKTLKDGKYDIIHCHHDLVSAIYLIASFGISHSRQIVHIHNSDEVIPVRGYWKQKLLREPFRRICWSFADKNIGISNHTLDSFRLGRKRRKNIDIVHYYGVDPTPFISLGGDKMSMRKNLGFPENAIIMLFAGRMDPAKNPLFAIDVLAELIKLNKLVIGLFVGTGSLVQQLKERALELGIENKFYYYGWRDDIPEIMTCSDLFILPHVEKPMEGLGLAIIEAQLTALPLLISYGVADDPLLEGSIFTQLHLSEGTKVWAEAAIKKLSLPRRTQLQAFDALKSSVFDMEYAMNDLISIYNNV